jgi:hypothetical protein
MTQDHDNEEMNEIRARLKASRSEISLLLDPPRDESGALTEAGGTGGGGSGFPRSRTMQMLTSNRGLGALSVLASGFLIARPGLAFKLLRLLPTGGVAKVVIARALSALAERKSGR